jgi:hypothetical protein
MTVLHVVTPVRLYSWGNGSGLWAAARLRVRVDHQEAPIAAVAALVMCALNAAWCMAFPCVPVRGHVRAWMTKSPRMSRGR